MTLGDRWRGLPIWGRTLLGLLGALLLNAIGSGLWEEAMRRPYWRLRNGLLSLVSWGIDSQKDALYRDIARGLAEQASTALLGIVIFAIFGVAVVGYANALFYFRLQRSRFSGEPQPLIMRFVKSNPDEDDRTVPRHLIVMKWLTWVGLISMLALGFSLGADAVKLNYKSRAVARYQQIRAAVAPFETPAFLLRSDSDFARIRTSQDYKDLLTRLDAVAAKNGIELEPFHPW